jgi:hypothetical protein
MKSLLTHALAVFGLVGTMTVLINLQGCENNDDTVAKVQESDTYTTSQSEEYAELSEYLDSVSNAYDIDVTLVTEESEVSEELPYDEESLEVVSTTEGDVEYAEVIRIEASTFGEAFATARYQLGFIEIIQHIMLVANLFYLQDTTNESYRSNSHSTRNRRLYTKQNKGQ